MRIKKSHKVTSHKVTSGPMTCDLVSCDMATLTRFINTKAQSLLEYVILVGIVAAVVVAMGPYFKRGIQAVVKVTADQMAPQQNADQDRESYLVNAFTSSRYSGEKKIRETMNVSKEYLFNDVSVETSSSFTNLGITEK